MIVQGNMTETSQEVIVGIPPILRAVQRPPRPKNNINVLSFKDLKSIVSSNLFTSSLTRTTLKMSFIISE